MLKKSIASVVSAALLVAGPGHMTLTASAQGVSRGAVARVTAIPAMSLTPSALTSSPVAAPSAVVSAPTLMLTAVKTALATPLLPAASKGAPLSVIGSRDPAVGVSKKAAALNEMFENSMRSGAQTLEGSLKPLKAAGFAVLPSGKFMTRKMEAAFNRGWKVRIEPKKGKATMWTVYERDGWDGPEWDTKSKAIRRFIYRSTSQLRKAAPKEEFAVDVVGVKVIEKMLSPQRHPHVDKGLAYYWTTSYPFESHDAASRRGTLIYTLSPDGKDVQKIQAGRRMAAIVSGSGRQAVTKIYGTMHAAPDGEVKRRIMLFIGYDSKLMPYAEDVPKRVYRNIRKREAQVRRLLKALGERVPKPPKKR